MDSFLGEAEETVDNDVKSKLRSGGLRQQNSKTEDRIAPSFLRSYLITDISISGSTASTRHEIRINFVSEALTLSRSLQNAKFELFRSPSWRLCII